MGEMRVLPVLPRLSNGRAVGGGWTRARIEIKWIRIGDPDPIGMLATRNVAEHVESSGQEAQVLTCL